MITVRLLIELVPSGPDVGQIYSLTRTVFLPVVFEGMTLYGLRGDPEGEDVVQFVWWRADDAGAVSARLRPCKYVPGVGAGVFSLDEVLDTFRGWDVTPLD